VLDKTDAKPKKDSWDLATRAEALLLLGEIKGAREAYLEAKGAAAGKDHDIAVMWRGAVNDLKKLRKPVTLLDDILRPRAAAAFFGHSVDSPGRQPPRLPSTGVKDVRFAIAAKIREHRIGFGICSACRGSDLLFLNELLQQDGRALIVLTSPREEFARTFVGATWRPIFDDIMSSGKVEVRVLEPATDTWLEVRRVVRAELKRHASVLACDRLLITVWNGEPGYVDDSVQLWEASGDPVEKIPVGTARGAVA
jgi:hypothetical protein